MLQGKYENCNLFEIVPTGHVAKMEQNFLQTFWKLSSIEEEERIKAAEDLLVLLKQHQVSSKLALVAGLYLVPQAAAKSTDGGVCSELEYAVQRLVKGLASNRKGARHGFYTALTQVCVVCDEGMTNAMIVYVCRYWWSSLRSQ